MNSTLDKYIRNFRDVPLRSASASTSKSNEATTEKKMKTCTIITEDIIFHSKLNAQKHT